LRWVLVVLGLGALAVDHFAFGDVKRPAGLFAVLIGLAVINGLWMAVSHILVRWFHASTDSDTVTVREARVFANAQVAVDLLMLTLILRYTGGIESPMVIFYLFHMAIGSLVLQWWQAVLQGLWAILLYAGLAWGEWFGWITPHYPFLSSLEENLHLQFPHVISAIVVMSCAVLGTLYFTLQIAMRLDVGERSLRRAHAALQKSQLAIRDLDQRRSRFMQTAAHQLKSPLAGIQTLTALIRDGLVPDEEMSPTCGKIIDRCRAGIHQVTELLTLARIQDTDPNRHRRACEDVGEVVEEIYNRQALVAREQGLTMTCDVVASQNLRAHVERQDLTDCVMNLVENAIKYTEAGGKVSVSVRREAAAARHAGGERRDYIAVTVSDTGMGIDPDALVGREGPAGAGSVFDAFRRGNAALAARIPGTGLGLSIVREIVEQAAGSIRVHSQPGRGSRFTVLFPAEGQIASTAVRDTRSSEIVVQMEDSTRRET
jgi:signal transduction histidine kinase